MDKNILENGGASDIKPVNHGRLYSLDALRGFDMFWIVSGEGIFHSLADAVMLDRNLTRNPENFRIAINGNLSWWETAVVALSNQLHHSPWNGFTFYDLIFPLFIFVSGVSMPFSIGAQLDSSGVSKGQVKKKIYNSLLKRTLILLLLGMVVNGLLQWKGYEQTRFASVLGRIALSCFFAAIIYINTTWRGQVYWLLGLLLGYWIILSWCPVPGFGAGVITPDGNFSGYVDRLLLPGKLHRRMYDPEGLLSTLPAIATAILGVLAGSLMRWQSPHYTPIKKFRILLITALLMLLAGVCWGVVFPINKPMWTSSFVLYAGGWSALLLALFYYTTDIKMYRKWASPFVWMGRNSILIYLAAHGLVNFESTSQFLFGGIINLLPQIWHGAALWFGVSLIQFWGLHFLYRRKIFWKI
ncbi:acyltransferase family protein [Foetidibacter luteolus]|uniref:acyltransferase family protein n=1 Tax=Foetidibacter luteolus TaxID=2608880 RepID=UPI00129BFB2E|nr:DUF5009 domain-containing protein [Foetidibacter luteolus]